MNVNWVLAFTENDTFKAFHINKPKVKLKDDLILQNRRGTYFKTTLMASFFNKKAEVALGLPCFKGFTILYIEENKLKVAYKDPSGNKNIKKERYLKGYRLRELLPLN